MVLSLESTSNRMFRIARSELVYNRLISIEEILSKINLVNSDDVLALARSIFHKDKFAISMLGPVENCHLDFYKDCFNP